jgi:hypothetical protein
MYTGGGGEQIFKKLVNKNAIKPKIGDPLAIFFLKALTPLCNFCLGLKCEADFLEKLAFLKKNVTFGTKNNISEKNKKLEALSFQDRVL